MKHPIRHNTFGIHQHQAGSKKTTQPSNPLNLPTSINFYSKDKKIDYIYTATGQKTEQKTVNNGRIENRRQYAGSFVFKNRQLSYAASIVGRFLYVDDGRGNTDFKNEFSLKDHTSVSLSTWLGNTRVTLDHGANIVQKIDYYPFGHMIYESDTETPFAEDNRYLYNGKELQDDFELNWYDYGARFYDAQIGRWHSVDPLAEDYYPITPYAYVANNPIVFIDPDGMKIRVAGKNRNQTYQDIAVIYGTPLGRHIIDQLHNSNQVYTIRDARTRYSTYRSRSNTVRYYQNDFIHQGNSFRSFESLGHELYHAFQDHQYGIKGRSEFELEKGAVKFENYLRKVYEEGAGYQRLKYAGKDLFQIGEATHFDTGGFTRELSSVNSFVEIQGFESRETNDGDPSIAKQDKTAVNRYLQIFVQLVFEYMNNNNVEVIKIDF